MGRKSKKKKKKKSPASPGKSNPKVSLPPVNPEALESPNAVAGTVAWLLSALTTLLAMLVSLICRWIYSRNSESETYGGIGLFLFAATVTGIATLVLTFLVLRVRRTPPPRNVTRGAIVIGLLPFVLHFAYLMLDG